MQQLIGLVGFIAILQLTFMPGYLALSCFKLKLPVIRLISLSFALSLLINYVIAGLLTIIHVYTPAVIWPILLLETIALIYALWPSSNSWQSLSWQCSQIKCFWQDLNNGRSLDKFIRLGLFFISLFILLGLIYQCLTQFGEIFTAWDPVMSYNVWASQWADNQLPVYTWHYPQLIPANWSMTYVIMQPLTQGLKLQIFAKAVMPLFPFMLVLMFFDLAIETRRSTYLLGLCLCFYFLYRFAECFGQGWVDVPMSYFSFLSIALLYLAGNSERPLSYIILAALSCGAAASTKQAGLYTMFWFPFLCYVLALKSQQEFSTPSKLCIIFSSCLLGLIICLPWYIYIQYLINHGLASSEVGFVTGSLYQVLGFSLGLRVIYGVIQAGLVFWLLLFLSLTYVRSKSPWIVLLPMVIIYSIIWVDFYSYADRNLVLISPLLGLLAALSLERLYRKGSLKTIGKYLWSRVEALDCKPLHILAGCTVLVGLITYIPQCSVEALYFNQITQQQALGDITLNKLLLNYKALHGFDGKILTSWDYLGHIPGLSAYYQPYRPASVEANPYQSSWMDNPKDLPVVLKQYPVKYILVANEGGLVTKAYLAYFNKLEAENILRPLINLPNFTLYEIAKPLVAPKSLHI